VRSSEYRTVPRSSGKQRPDFGRDHGLENVFDLMEELGRRRSELEIELRCLVWCSAKRLYTLISMFACVVIADNLNRSENWIVK
jgi:hypothetical protein